MLPSPPPLFYRRVHFATFGELYSPLNRIMYMQAEITDRGTVPGAIPATISSTILSN